MSRRAATFAAICVAIVALIAASGVLEARSAPSWVTRLIHAVTRRSSQRAMPVTTPLDTTVVFGPKTFAVGGAPTGTFVEAFTLTAPDSGGYALRVTNGPGGSTRATAGSVKLNGREVVSGTVLGQMAAGTTRDFPVTVAAVDTVVATLFTSATISVSLVSLPDPTYRIYGPTTFTNAPGIQIVGINVPVGAVAPFYLCFRNGNADGTQRNAGFNVRVNSTTVLTGPEMAQNVPGFLVQVPLNVGNNFLRLSVGAFASGTSTLTVCATATDSIRPVVTISAPAPSLITKLTQVTMAGVVKEQTVVRITLNGQLATVVPDTGGRTNYSGSVPLAADGPNVITVSARDAAGNQTDSTRTVIRDTGLPVLTLNGLPSGSPIYKGSTALTVTGTITDLTALTLNVNGQPIVIDTAAHTFTTNVTLVRGSNFLTFTATDAAGNVTTEVRQIIVDDVQPTLTVATPVDGLVTKLLVAHVTGTVAGSTAVTVTVNAVPTPVNVSGAFATDVAIAEGSNAITIVATNAGGLTTTIVRNVIRDTQAPALVVNTPSNGTTTSNAQTTVAGTVTDATAVHVTANGAPAPLTAGAFSVIVPLAVGANTITVAATDSAGNSTTISPTVTRTGGPTTGFTETLGIDSSVNAPMPDPTVLVPLAARSSFLYTGPSAPQQGVATGTIQPAMAGILRGRVTDRAGSPLSGVTVKVLNHPEYGTVHSRSNGLYELVVNAGGPITLDFQSMGLIPAQRSVVTEQQDFTIVSDVALVTLDAASTVVNFTAPIEVARASTVTDMNGTRRATLMFTQGTVATAIKTGVSPRVLSSITVRATEYTVGPNGQSAMPAELPATSEYTYAVELSADEIDPAGTEALTFSNPVAFYLENYRNFPVGFPVPMGFYDRQRGIWIPENNGRVVRVLSVTGGVATLDVKGDSTPATQGALDSLGVASAELAQVGQLYAEGQTLWRAPISHFSPWDGNFPQGEEEDKRKGPDDSEPKKDETAPDPCKQSGSIIECENQILGERLPIAGTALSLNYRSDRVPGLGRYSKIEIPVIGDSVPEGLIDMIVTIDLAGRRFQSRLLPLPNQKVLYSWDGVDAFGHPINGSASYTVGVTYRYPKLYGLPTTEAQSFGMRCISNDGATYWAGSFNVVTPRVNCVIPGVSDLELNLVKKLQIWRGTIGGWTTAAAQGFGGWTLEPHHVYDPVSKTLYLGSGDRISAREVVKPDRLVVSGGGTTVDAAISDLDGLSASTVRHGTPSGIVVTAVGDVLFADSTFNVVRKISPTGVITRFAGVFGTGGLGPVGALARATALSSPRGLSLGPDGSLYIADAGNHRVLRVRPDSIVELVAGAGGIDTTGDGGLATAANIGSPSRIAAGTDGSVYIMDAVNATVRVVTPSGRIATAAGNGTSGQCGANAIIATESCLVAPKDIAVAPDGTLYIADARRVRAVRPNGFISTAAGRNNGCSSNAFEGEGTATAMCALGLSVTHDGTLYMTDAGFLRRLDVDGHMVTVHTCGPGFIEISSLPRATRQVASGRAHGPSTTDAEESSIEEVTNATDPIGCLGLAVGPNGSVYVSEAPERVAKIALPNPGYAATDFIIASPNGDEFYEFDVNVRHLATRAAGDGGLLASFAYDSTQRLLGVTDRFNNQVTIARDVGGKAIWIQAPFGQRTNLTYDSNDWLVGAQYPDSSNASMTYAVGGLLASVAMPGIAQTTFNYDTLGRFTGEDGPLGWHQSLAVLTDSTGQVNSSFTNAAGLTTVRTAESARSGGRNRTSTTAGGGTTSARSKTDGGSDSEENDGTRTHADIVADTLFGMQVPRMKSARIQVPGIDDIVSESQHHITLSNASDPRTIVSILDSVLMNGRVTTTTTNIPAGLFTISYPDARTDSAIVDALGNVVEARVSGTARAFHVYDSFGRQTEARVANRITKLAYGLDGMVAVIMDPLGLQTAFQRDRMGRVITAVRPDSQSIEMSYDIAGRLLAFRAPTRPPFQFSYDTRGRTTSVTAPIVTGEMAAVTTYSYDAVRLTALTRPDGQQIGYGYDSLGQLATIIATGDNQEYVRAPVTGLIQSIASDRYDTLSFTYAGRLVSSMSWAGRAKGSISMGYTADLLPSHVTVDGGQRIEYGYGADGKLVSVGSLGLSYNSQTGFVDGVVLGALATAWTYDSLGEVRSATHAHSGTPLLRRDFRYDKLGRVDSLTEVSSAGTIAFNYRYDAVGRLTTVSENGTVVGTYEYDANGNRIRETTALGVVAASYDERDRLKQYGQETFAYSPNGDMTTRTIGTQTTRYSYDSFRHLIRVVLPDSQTITYELDPAGQRIGRRLNGVLTQRLLYQGNLTPVAALDSSGQVIAQFVYARQENVPEYMIAADGSNYRFVLDERGSVRLVVRESTGEVVQEIRYDAWGRETFNSNPGFQPFGYAGGLVDDQTHLVHFGVREYDPQLGRWISEDPVMLAGGDANLHAYARGNPITNSDPSGQIPLPIVTGLIGGAASFAGNVLGQLWQNGGRWSCVSWTNALINGGTGFVAGALAPTWGVTWVGATLLGAGSNVASYFITQGVNGESLSWAGAGWSTVSGAIGGAIGGAFTRVAPGYDAMKYTRLHQRTAALLNGSATLKANSGFSNGTRNLLGSGISGTDWPPLPGSGANKCPCP